MNSLSNILSPFQRTWRLSQEIDFLVMIELALQYGVKIFWLGQKYKLN